MEASAVGKFHILLAEVEFELEKGSEVYQLLAQLFQLFGITATQLADSEAMGGSIGGVDKVGNSFDLREIQFPIKKRLAGKLTRFRQSGTAVDERLEDGLLNILGTVT